MLPPNMPTSAAPPRPCYPDLLQDWANRPLVNTSSLGMLTRSRGKGKPTAGVFDAGLRGRRGSPASVETDE